MSEPRPASIEDDRGRHWLSLMLVPGVGPVVARTLVARFGSPEGVFAAPREELLGVDGIGRELAGAITGFRPEKALGRTLEEVRNKGLVFIHPDHPSYPRLLSAIPYPPPVLFAGGELRPEEDAVAIVGTRYPSRFGREFAEKLAFQLAGEGLTVVSGLARGIDAAAHRGALKAGGRTIGIMGCGHDHVYPPEHAELHRRVRDAGALVSEYLPHTPPNAGHFPTRNRIISGLSLGVVVVEGGLKSGALITAKLALDQGREVFAVPGAAGRSLSRGPNRLIKEGAALVESAGDVLDALFLSPAPKTREPGPGPEVQLEGEEKGLYELLGSDPVHIDDLARSAGLDPAHAAGLLLSLELKGMASQMPGKYFVRS